MAKFYANFRAKSRERRQESKKSKKSGGLEKSPPKTGLWDKDMSRVPRLGTNWISCK